MVQQALHHLGLADALLVRVFGDARRHEGCFTFVIALVDISPPSRRSQVSLSLPGHTAFNSECPLVVGSVSSSVTRLLLSISEPQRRSDLERERESKRPVLYG